MNGFTTITVCLKPGVEGQYPPETIEMSVCNRCRNVYFKLLDKKAGCPLCDHTHFAAGTVSTGYIDPDSVEQGED